MLTVKGVGHMVPLWKRLESQTFFFAYLDDNWTSITKFPYANKTGSTLENFTLTDL